MKTKHINSAFIIGIGSFLLSGCAIFAPVNSSFENARILKKNAIEFNGHYSSYYLKEFNDVDIINRNFGFRFGVGLDENVDLKLRYEYLVLTEASEKDHISYFSIIPRFNIKRDKCIFSIPVGVYRSNYFNIWFVSPGFTFSKRYNKNIELNYCTRLETFMSVGEIYWGNNLGFGLSDNLDQWAIRPEIGFMKYLPELHESTFLTYGIGFTYYLKDNKKQKAVSKL